MGVHERQRRLVRPGVRPDRPLLRRRQRLRLRLLTTLPPQPDRPAVRQRRQHLRTDTRHRVERRRAVGVQQGQQQPLPRRTGGGHRLRHHRRAGQRREIPQLLLHVLSAVQQDQLLLGPGHGHIEQAHLLRQQFLLQGQRHPGPGQGGKLHHSLPVQSLGPQSQPRVKENRLLQIPIVDPPSQAAEKDHRVLQPFGAVDGEDFHPGLLLGRGRHRRQAPALPYPVQMKEEAEEPFVSRSLKPSGQFIEGE